VKVRAYGDGDDPKTRSARATLAIALSVLQRLLAPFLPFVTDEVWHWWHEGSVHRAPWPTVAELGVAADPAAGVLYASVGQVLEAIRREKSSAKVSQRAGVERLVVAGPEGFIAAVLAGSNDLKDAGTVAEIVTKVADEVDVNVILATA